MFGFNDDSATLINEVLINRTPSYYITFLKNIDWQQTTIIKFLKTLGSKPTSDNKVVVFVNYGDYQGKKYVGPKTFKNIENKEEYYTFEEGNSILIKGIHNITINNTKEFMELQNQFDDYVKVVSVTKCDLTKHFELGCE